MYINFLEIIILNYSKRGDVIVNMRHLLTLPLACIILSVTGCNKEDSVSTVKTFELTSIAEPGVYSNIRDETTDYIQIFDNNTLQFINFDESELSEFYEEAYKNEGMTEEEFLSGLRAPYNVRVRESDADGIYKISIPFVGEEASLWFVLNYDSDVKTISYHENDYKLEITE